MLDNYGIVSIVAPQIATFSYFCPQFTISLSQSTFTCSDLGTKSVTITAHDVVNSPTIKTCQVQVVDNIEPIVECRPYSVVLNAAGTASITAADITQSVTDNCPGTTISASQTVLNCSMLGEISVYVMANDSSNNQAICKSVVSVFDQTSPILTCNSATANLDSNGFAVISPSNVSVATDNCGPPFVTLSKSSFDCSNVGTNQVTVTATDGGGNQVSCVASVTISDTLGGVPSCQNVELFLNQQGVATLVPSQAINQISGGCGSLTFSAATTSFSCSPSGTTNYPVVITATDSQRVKNPCTSQVSVSDSISPILTCNPISYSLTSSTPITFNPSSGISQIIDNCPSSAVTLTASQTSLGCSNIGTNFIEITGTDAYNNMGYCTSTVTLAVTAVPSLNCTIGVQTVNLSSTFPGIYYFSATNHSNSSAVCGNPTLTGDQTYGCSNVGLNSASIHSTDSYGNTATCSVQLNVLDSTIPSLSCPSTSYVYINNGTASLNATAVAFASDNCGAIINSNATTYTCASIGNQIVNITATDPSGNVGTCTTQVIISRPTPAVATCNPIVVVTLQKPSFTGTLNVSMLLQSYTDACPVVSTTITPKTNYSISDLSSGPLNVVVTLTDTQPSNFSCSSSVYIIVPILDGISNIRKIHTGFVIRWDTSVASFKGKTVTFYYFNAYGNKVIINPSPVQYNTGSFNWLSGFNQVNVNNYYNLYMTVASLLVDIFPIFVVA